MKKGKIGLVEAMNCTEDFRDSLDQQLLRLTNCTSGGGGYTSTTQYEVQQPVFYEQPTGLPVNAPLDATQTDPGTPATEQPAPSATTVQTATAVNTVTTGGVMQWIKDNPMIAGGGALLLLYLVMKRKKR